MNVHGSLPMVLNNFASSTEIDMVSKKICDEVIGLNTMTN